jgi:hypothetical protein
LINGKTGRIAMVKMMNMDSKNFNDEFCTTNILLKMSVCFIPDENHCNISKNKSSDTFTSVPELYAHI